MKIENIELTKTSIKFKLVGERHTIVQMLKNELLEDKDVNMASYTMSHPEDKDTLFYLNVKDGKDPKKVLNKAVDSLIDGIREFEKKALDLVPKTSKVAASAKKTEDKKSLKKAAPAKKSK